MTIKVKTPDISDVTALEVVLKVVRDILPTSAFQKHVIVATHHEGRGYVVEVRKTKRGLCVTIDYA